jgi:peptidoglycan/LPS O-acetylase OafA/YrhL
MFFVLSGFLITFLLLKEKKMTNTINYKFFFIRRALRIWPLYFLYLLILILIFGVDSFRGTLVYYVFFMPNFVNLVVAEYGVVPVSKVLSEKIGHYWSLGVEEQFYIFWPLILLWAYKQSWPIGRLISGLIVLSCLICNYVSSISAVTAFYWLPTRAWQLLAGAGLAYLQLHGSPSYQLLNQEFKKNVLSVVGLVVIFFSASQLSAGNVYPGYWALIPTIGAVLVIFSGEQSWVNKKILARKWIVYVGLISYPLYLWHWPIISFARIMGNGEVARTTKIVCFLIKGNKKIQLPILIILAH